MKVPKDLIDVEEAITLIMQRQGKSRRQAKAELFEMARSGKLPTFGVDLETDEVVCAIPPEAWPKVN